MAALASSEVPWGSPVEPTGWKLESVYTLVQSRLCGKEAVRVKVAGAESAVIMEDTGLTAPSLKDLLSLQTIAFLRITTTITAGAANNYAPIAYL